MAGALVVVIGLRLVSLPFVYADGHVVLSGNDPYAYRYVVDQLLTNTAVSPQRLPGAMQNGEPLYVVTMWAVAIAFGGSVTTAGHVLAWYPVVSAVLTAVMVYAATVLVTDDRRIGLAATVMLAVIPAHALRTGLGFADHHAFDYVWLSLTVLGLVLIAWTSRVGERSVSANRFAGILMVALGVAGQVLAWDSAPILLVAFGLYVSLEVLRSVHNDESPLRTTGPILVGIGLAAGLVFLVHTGLGWQSTLVATTPLLLLIGSVGAVGTGEIAHRFRLSAVSLGIIDVLLGVVGLLGLTTLLPAYWSRFITRVETALIAQRSIAEVQSIFSEAGGWLLLFGFILLVALPYLAWGTYRATTDGRWLPVAVYGWYFFGLSTIQARFAGDFSPIIAVFAGLAFVHLAERIDVARRPAPFTTTEPPDLRLPDAKQAGYLFALFVLVAGLSVAQVPVKTSQVATPPELSDTAFYLADRSAERGLSFPENRVLSEWDKSRVYNYFVSGESRGYGFSHRRYQKFVTRADPGTWYTGWGDEVGFVVVTSEVAKTGPGQIGTLLYTHLGSRTDTTRGLARYRLIYVSESGEYKAFELVPGAVLQGQTTPNTTVTATTTVEVPGATFTYTRATTAKAAGNYTLRVAHPGTYEIAGQTATVTEEAVWNGSTVVVDKSSN